MLRTRVLYWIGGAALIGVAATLLAAEALLDRGGSQTDLTDQALIADNGKAQAQPAVPAGSDKFIIAPGEEEKPVGPSEYWLGIWCAPVPPALRTQLGLPEGQGVLVEEVAPNSPAAQAGVARFDVLLRVGDKRLTQPRDLVEVVEAAKETKLKIDLLRSGKPKTIEAAPAKRPENAGRVEALPNNDDLQIMQRWMQQMWPGGGTDTSRPSMRYRFFHPGTIVPPDVASAPTPLPQNMSIVVSKEGGQPAKITVKRGDQHWEITEKELDKLPADVRPHVERMLGRGWLGAVGGAGALDFVPEMTPGQISPQIDKTLPADFGAWEKRLERRMEEINSRLDKLMGRMETAIEGRPRSPTTGQSAEEHEKN